MLRSNSIIFSKVTTCRSLNYAQQRNLMMGNIHLAVEMLTIGATMGCGYALSLRYKVAKPDEMIAMTGPMINGIDIRQRAFQWPFQTFKFIKMHPRTHKFELNAISNDFIKFVLPGTFIIGPDTENFEMLERYAKLLEGMDDYIEDGDNETPFESIVFNTIDGCTRVFASQLTIDEINSDIKKFKETIIAGTQEELNKLGLIIYNATIRELKDSNDSTYFHNRSQKKEKETENNAKIDIAEAVKKGTIGAKERDAHTRQRVSQFEADTIKMENERKQEMEKSAALLKIVQSEQLRLTTIAKIEADNAAKIRQAELEKEVEQKRIQTETERIRAVELSKAHAMADTLIKTAEGEAAAIEIKAKAHLFAKQKEAEGIYSILKAQADGLHSLVESVDDRDTLIKYLMMEKGVYVDLAKENAKAVQNLNPKISIWNTGSDSSNVSDTLANVIKTVIPLTDTIHQQTGMTLLEHLTKRSDPKKDDY